MKHKISKAVQSYQDSMQAVACSLSSYAKLYRHGKISEQKFIALVLSAANCFDRASSEYFASLD